MKSVATWKKIFLLLIVVGSQCMVANSQSLSNIHYKSFSLESDTLLLDSFSIVPNTIAVRGANGNLVDSSDYIIKAFESKLIWKNKPATDSVKVFFRTYPFSLARETYHKNYSEYLNASANTAIRPFIYNPEEVGGKLIDFGNLEYNGSFSRGLAFGSNQSVSLNSLFNLQLSGMLTRDLEITAAVTDNNIPIQPEGNTQQIQEFDKIFIQLRQGGHKVIVGDFDLFNPEKNYFLKFSKKYLGGDYSGSFDLKKHGVFKTEAAGGIMRGKFARNTLTVSEGNQGPYKLLGANGETVIIILANSEAVFINGVKMERGADRDYVIDYNLGEVTFMPRKIITQDLRVVVEFEYSDQNYQRSTAFLNTEYITKKADVYFNLYTEQDSKGQSLQQNLNDEKKRFLSTVGDSLSNAFYRGFDSVAFDANRILYRLVPDSLGFDSVFVYSTDSTVAKYALNFSLVGNGKGNYVPAASTANGRVYEWVAPIVDSEGVHPQGSYEPVIALVTPKYQQMYTLGTNFKTGKVGELSAEAAMSNTDLNMFSKKDDNDNLGFAARVNYKGTLITKTDSANTQTGKENFTYELHYEFLQNRFVTIERYRNVEFARDWNLGAQQQQHNEHLAVANLGYTWNNLGNISYRFKTFIQDTVYQGFENALNGNFSKNGFNINFTNSYLNSTSQINKSDFIRPRVDFYYASAKTKGWKIGTLIDHEINMLKNKEADTLASTSYLWQNYKVYATTPDSAHNKFGIEYIMRYQHRAQGNGFASPYFAAQTITATGQVNTAKNQTLNYSLTYRHVKNEDSLQSEQPEHFYLGRIDYNISALKGFFRSTTLYEVGSGRQQKTQVIYLASPTNQGDFIYPENGDVNGNGVKDISEFVPRPAGFTYDSSYIRTFIVTPEYVSVNTNQFNQVININPAALWRNATGAKKVLAMFSLFASISITKKTFAEKNKRVGDYFNPIPLKREDTQLVSTSVISRNTLFFNRLDPKYGFQFDFSYSQNRTLLTTGFENSVMQSQGVTARWNVFKTFNIQTVYTNGYKANQSDFYANMKYRFSFHETSADLSYQFQSFLRISTKYNFSHKANPTDTTGVQTAQQHKFTLEAKYNRQNKNSITASVSYASILYLDRNIQNQQLEYAMLEGLQNGNNLIWGVGYSQNLSQNIQLTISYDGRMTGFDGKEKSTLKPVHTGRAEIRAMF